MIQESEIIVPALALGGHILYLFPFVRTRIRSIPHSALLFASYYFLCGAWIFTIVEGIALPNLSNLLEHACYFISALLVMGWSRLLWAASKASSE